MTSSSPCLQADKRFVLKSQPLISLYRRITELLQIRFAYLGSSSWIINHVPLHQDAEAFLWLRATLPICNCPSLRTPYIAMPPLQRFSPFIWRSPKSRVHKRLFYLYIQKF